MLMSQNVLFLLQRYGQEVTLRKISYSAYDPSTGTVTPSTDSDTTVKSYIADYNLTDVDGDNVVMGDRKAYIPTTDTSGNSTPKPDTDDLILGVGDKVKIVRVQELYNADNLVCYICQVRE